MIEVNGKQYELKYSLKRIELIENATGAPLMAELVKNSGMFSLGGLKTYFAYGLKEIGSDSFVKVKEGMDIAEALIESEGYISPNQEVVAALERDCPFFFQVD